MLCPVQRNTISNFRKGMLCKTWGHPLIDSFSNNYVRKNQVMSKSLDLREIYVYIYSIPIDKYNK